MSVRGRTTAFLFGAGVGYFMATRPGRSVVTQAKAKAGDVWRDPRLQAYVKDLEEQALAFAKEQGTALKDRVMDAATSATGGQTAGGAHSWGTARWPGSGRSGVEDEVVVEGDERATPPYDR